MDFDHKEYKIDFIFIKEITIKVIHFYHVIKIMISRIIDFKLDFTKEKE